MKNVRLKNALMGRICKRGHEVTGYNAIAKRIADRTYYQCRQCENLMDMRRRKFEREREKQLVHSNSYRHVVRNNV